ncbi:hypothetical protein [Amycolatopsis sp. NPDC059657]|uniref:hypothetical protein n=1 Tax=Amycolatopsis sp. NPDC059657 TaxID=3346899 RepID=UPI0036714034
MAERMGLTDQAVPSLAFEVYDLKALEGQQWLESVDNSPVSPVWLGHRGHDGREAALIGTLPRVASADASGAPGRDALSRSIGKLMNVVEPGSPPELRSALGHRVRAHLESQASQIEVWPRVSWTVAGVGVSAALLRFAGAWLAITNDLPESYIAVIGVGISPEDHEIVVTRGEAYGIDFTGPISIGQMNRLPVGQMPQPNLSQPHPDLLPLLGR